MATPTHFLDGGGGGGGGDRGDFASAAEDSAYLTLDTALWRAVDQEEPGRGDDQQFVGQHEEEHLQSGGFSGVSFDLTVSAVDILESPANVAIQSPKVIQSQLENCEEPLCLTELGLEPSGCSAVSSTTQIISASSSQDLLAATAPADSSSSSPVFCDLSFSSPDPFGQILAESRPPESSTPASMLHPTSSGGSSNMADVLLSLKHAIVHPDEGNWSSHPLLPATEEPPPQPQQESSIQVNAHHRLDNPTPPPPSASSLTYPCWLTSSPPFGLVHHQSPPPFYNEHQWIQQQQQQQQFLCGYPSPTVGSPHFSYTLHEQQSHQLGAADAGGNTWNLGGGPTQFSPSSQAFLSSVASPTLVGGLGTCNNSPTYAQDVSYYHNHHQAASEIPPDSKEGLILGGREDHGVTTRTALFDSTALSVNSPRELTSPESAERLYGASSPHRTSRLHPSSPDSSTDNTKNVCGICGKTYARPSTLKTHLRTHSGERPYRCYSCNKSFSQAANLTAHCRTHSGEKPFHCAICNRKFSQSSSVTTHMRTHSGERPYRCRLCKKAFSDSSTLTKHLRIHSGEKPYQCKLCHLRFSQSGNLNRHMRIHAQQQDSSR